MVRFLNQVLSRLKNKLDFFMIVCLQYYNSDVLGYSQNSCCIFFNYFFSLFLKDIEILQLEVLSRMVLICTSNWYGPTFNLLTLALPLVRYFIVWLKPLPYFSILTALKNLTWENDSLVTPTSCLFSLRLSMLAQS